MKYCLSILYLFFFSSTMAQNAKEKVLDLDAFITQIKLYHPLAKQANLQVDKAKAELLGAKGAFDPTVSFDASRKTFDGKNYYFYTNPEIKIPLPVGDIKTGVESNGGSFLNSEFSSGNTSYFGFELPLAKGLLLDKRRAALQQAKIYRNQSEQERLRMLNDLLFDAYVSYGNWAGAYQLYNIFSNYVKISSDRIRLIRLANANGDRSVMDTLEAFTQLQNFQLLQTDALVKLTTAALEINTFLWLDNDSSYLLPNNTIPDAFLLNNPIAANTLEDFLGKGLNQNPNINEYNFKLDALEVERKLKQQSLLPTLNAKANLLNKDYWAFNGLDGNFLQNNYKWGIDFKIPIFLREARGDVQKAKIKIAETSLQLSQKKWEVENKIRNYFNEFVQLQNQVNIANATFNNYNSLYRSELLRFNNGESSLFLVNSRENKALEMLQKTIELRIKLYKSRYAIDWSAGQLK